MYDAIVKHEQDFEVNGTVSGRLENIEAIANKFIKEGVLSLVVSRAQIEAGSKFPPNSVCFASHLSSPIIIPHQTLFIFF
jgi:hypothetical protein